MENVIEEIRPRMIDHPEDFFPTTVDGLKHIEQRTSFYINKLKDRGLLLTLFHKTRTFREFYTALKITYEMDNILDRGGAYEEVFRTVVYFDYDLANLVFLWNVKDRMGEMINNAYQLQALTNISIQYMREIQNSFNLASQARYRNALEEILRAGGYYKDLLETNPKDYGLQGDQWEAVAYRVITKEDLVETVANNHFILNDLIGGSLPRLKGDSDSFAMMIKQTVFSSLWWR